METVTFEWHSSHSIKRDESGRSAWMLRSLWSCPSCTEMCQKLLPKDFGLSCEPEWSNWAAFQCCFCPNAQWEICLTPELGNTNWHIAHMCCFGFSIVFEPFGNRKGEQVPLSKSKTTLGQDLTYKQTNKTNRDKSKQPGGEEQPSSELRNVLRRSQLWCIGCVSWCVFCGLFSLVGFYFELLVTQLQKESYLVNPW